MNVDRIIFFGTPDFAIPALDALIQKGHNVVLVVTQPDKKAGRGKKLTAPPIKTFCEQNKIPYIQPKSIKTKNFRKQLEKYQGDLYVVAAYGRLFTSLFLSKSPLMLNVHASLLPRWRGASPISRSILFGDEKTGVSIMKIVPELDAGPYMVQKQVQIEKDDDTASLTTKLANLGGVALLEALEKIQSNQYEWTIQDETKATFAPILRVEDAKIDWNRNADEIQHHIRSYSPSPGAYTFDGKERIKIFKSDITRDVSSEAPGTFDRQKKKLRVSCSDMWLEIIELQREGKSRQGIIDFLNGYPMERKQWIS